MMTMHALLLNAIGQSTSRNISQGLCCCMNMNINHNYGSIYGRR